MKKDISCLILVFNKLPTLNAKHIEKEVLKIESLSQPVKTNIQIKEKGILHAEIAFENHKIKLVGFSSPVPNSVIVRTITTSNWTKEDKLPIQKHKAHILCYYEGENLETTEQLIAIYKIAFTFLDYGLLGVLDEDAWNCIPAKIVSELMKPETIRICREEIPIGLWTGFVKFFKDKDFVWFCTKGYHKFGIIDLAYLGTIRESQNTFNIFEDLFLYLRDGNIIKAGDTAQVGEYYLRFREVYEYSEYLNGPIGTLVFENITLTEVNTI